MHNHYNRYSYVLNNPLKYTDPSGWRYMFLKDNKTDDPPINFDNFYSNYGGGSGGGYSDIFSFGNSSSSSPHYNWSTGQYMQGGQMIDFYSALNYYSTKYPNSVASYQITTWDNWYGSASNPNAFYNGRDYTISQIYQSPIGQTNSNRNAQGGEGGESADYLLAKLYWHNQFGGGADYNINASTLDFSGTSQRELGLAGMKPGDIKYRVNLFSGGINQNSLAFGKLDMVYEGNNQFSVISNRFDFDYQSNASFGRNAGTFVGGAVFGQFYTIPITPFSILRDITGFGGSFMINFNGTVTIPK